MLPCADAAAMLFWVLMASGQIRMRRADGWQTIAKPLEQPVDLAAGPDSLPSPGERHAEFQHELRRHFSLKLAQL